MPSPYTHCLATNDQKGDVDGITLNWPASAFTKKLNTAVERTHQSRELLKALTEHLIWDACKRLQNTGARIIGPPHTFTVDSASGERTDQLVEHVSADMKGANPGSVHVYFEVPNDNWEQIVVVGMGFVPRGQNQPDPSFTWGKRGPTQGEISSNSSQQGQGHQQEQHQQRQGHQGQQQQGQQQQGQQQQGQQQQGQHQQRQGQQGRHQQRQGQQGQGHQQHHRRT